MKKLFLAIVFLIFGCRSSPYNNTGSNQKYDMKINKVRQSVDSVKQDVDSLRKEVDDVKYGPYSPFNLDNTK